MLITKEIEIKIHNCNISYYKKLGYNVKNDDIIKILVEHLSKGNDIKVDVKCDICDTIRKVPYRNYINYHTNDIDVCNKKECVQIKIKKSNLLKYGNECYYFTNDFKEKSNKTKIEKYNDINYNNPTKNKKTHLEKYGFEHALQIDNFKEKSNKTKIEKYGNKNYVNPEKTKKTCLEKYGVDNVLKLSSFRKKILNTRLNNRLKILSKYGIKEISDNNEYICINNHIFTDDDFILNRIRYKTILCPICNPIGSYSNSGYEIQLQDFVKNNYTGITILNSRKIIKPYELDIYIPDLKLAFEFNGLFWHNESGVDNNYHLNKTEICEKNCIKLIHIYDDDWIYKQEIVKSRILNLLGKTPNKIYARKCVIKEIKDNKLIREFLENNHLQGFVGSPIKLGLFYNNELVSLMTFGSKRKFMKQRNSDDVYEMLRFCSKINTSVIGGSEKLFKYFIKKYNPVEVISYADRSWSLGELYYKLKFLFVSKTTPNYYYIIDKKRYHRFGFRKDKLIRDGFDPNKTEHEIMLERKIYRIYDSGSLKFIWKN